MLDFPNSPTNGQLFASGGMTWRYDGTKWSETAGTLALADAPSDGNTYGRRNTAWNSVDAMLAPVAANANAALHDTGRNLLHNGTFVVQQRGTGPWTVTGAYTADRWVQWLGTGDTINVVINPMSDAIRAQIGNEAASSALYSTFTGSSNAAGLVLVQQKIEGLRRLSGKTVAVSFWAASNSGTPKLGVSIDEDFGTGGSPSAGVSGVGQSVTISTIWTRYVLAFTLASTAGKTFGTNGDDKTVLNFWMSTGSNYNTASGNVGVQTNGIALWGIQLEIGSVATPLDAGGSPQQILAQCQRFYQTGTIQCYGYNVTGGGIANSNLLPVVMRATPTVTPTITNNVNVSSAMMAAGAPGWVNISGVATASGVLVLQGNFTASADL